MNGIQKEMDKKFELFGRFCAWKKHFHANKLQISLKIDSKNRLFLC